MADTPPTPPNPFDPAALRLSQDFASSIGVKRVLTTVPCRKPNRHEFVRVRPGEDWRLETGVFEDKVNREVYLVQRDLWAELAGEVYPVCLFLAANRQGDVFLWPVKLPGSDGRSNTWNESALAAARLSESKWVRVAANMPGGMYDVFEAAGELSEPTWPELSFSEVLEAVLQGSVHSIRRSPGHSSASGAGLMDVLRHFPEVWLCDFEFREPDGQRPEPVCMVAREWRTGRTIREWADRLASMSRPPFSGWG